MRGFFMKNLLFVKNIGINCSAEFHQVIPNNFKNSVTSIRFIIHFTPVLKFQ
jgi:hypothetical protein